MKTDELRSLFLEYFKERGHRIFSSDRLCPQDDPTLLFTGAGMNQFKPYFLGLKKDLSRAASCQKCVRTADLERVGETAYHHTFFEMLGNFSFGDYFKEQAIAYGWDFVSKVLAIPEDRLWVSVYHEDSEAFDLWKKKIGLPESRIMKYGAEDNFWPSNAPSDGPNGPCGPCSEIYVGETPGKGVEIWNLVFTEFDRGDGGVLSPLPQKNIDTGMGLERLAAVMQGVPSNFDIDLFVMIRDRMCAADPAGHFSTAPAKVRNAVMDHLRAVVFSVTDGITPSNEGRGYVVRKLIRKAVLHLKSAGCLGPALSAMVPAICQTMAGAYPELRHSQANAVSVVAREEEALWGILSTRVPEAQNKILASIRNASGSAEQARSATRAAFEFYDTYGVPRDILEDILEGAHVAFDEKVFADLLETQRERSRGSSRIAGSIFVAGKDGGITRNVPETEFVGYDGFEAEARVLAYVVDGKPADCLEAGSPGMVITDRTPFYAEQGGQVGDTGILSAGGSTREVTNTRKEEGWVLHETQGGCKLTIGESVRMQVNEDRRRRITANHTATHLLHAALREVLGDHVKQKGSYVGPDRLRFDFYHYEAMKPAEIDRVTQRVNRWIADDLSPETRVQTTREAVASGAMAFFGDKYGDEVRVVRIGPVSSELCGGTHARQTAEIGLFCIVSESSIQSGVRRIEAVTGAQARGQRDLEDAELKEIEAFLGSDHNRVKADLKTAVNRLKQLQVNFKNVFLKSFRRLIEVEASAAPVIAGTRLVVLKMEVSDKELLREAADWLRSRAGSNAIVLAGVIQEKPQIVVALSADLIKKNLRANDLVRGASAEIGGNGGGRPDLALGGGKLGADPDRALQFAASAIRGALE
ncbi:MAG: alanine--tRNA ligase [Candidatus Omnitrophica bacterium]|nr:alanine--tRNA ligase [Candidatus Omnitrophota bacterium]